ncbi:transposase [Candidatus Eisenbacteria bacterium]|uniref:Mutator family transposase n=1 Tax=Eiseniibacteriota bacterium TaxID=2212470 RepID=A0ABV6YLE8_UNCEI
MGSVLRSASRRKKRKRIGPPQVIRREDYQEQGVNGRLELIRALIPLGLIAVYEELEAEVEQLAGQRYSRKPEGAKYYRHGSNHGSVKLAGQRIPVSVTRVRCPEGEVPLSSYRRLHKGEDHDEGLFRRLLYGISCRDYEAAAEAVPGAIGLSGSTVSRQFIEASQGKLREFQERDFSGQDIVAIFVDGKSFAKDQMVLALGIQMDGQKVMLGFVQTETENTRVLVNFFRSLLDRGLDVSRGTLVVIDGAKGLRSAVKKAFSKRALVQRCQWHKRENVISHLAKSEQAHWRRRLQKAYERPTYKEAKEELLKLHAELEELNQSAARSLAEGLEETLTLHRLGVFANLGRSFKTTNCIESVNSMAERKCGKVDYWKNSAQKHRWFASALLDIEPRLRKVMGYRQLYKLRDALMTDLGIKSEELISKRAA